MNTSTTAPAAIIEARQHLGGLRRVHAAALDAINEAKLEFERTVGERDRTSAQLSKQREAPAKELADARGARDVARKAYVADPSDKNAKAVDAADRDERLALLRVADVDEKANALEAQAVEAVSAANRRVEELERQAAEVARGIATGEADLRRDELTHAAAPASFFARYDPHVAATFDLVEQLRGLEAQLEAEWQSHRALEAQLRDLGAPVTSIQDDRTSGRVLAFHHALVERGRVAPHDLHGQALADAIHSRAVPNLVRMILQLLETPPADPQRLDARRRELAYGRAHPTREAAELAQVRAESRVPSPIGGVMPGLNGRYNGADYINGVRQPTDEDRIAWAQRSE